MSLKVFQLCIWNWWCKFPVKYYQMNKQTLFIKVYSYILTFNKVELFKGSKTMCLGRLCLFSRWSGTPCLEFTTTWSTCWKRSSEWDALLKKLASFTTRSALSFTTRMFLIFSLAFMKLVSLIHSLDGLFKNDVLIFNRV